jgi:enoyl reductase
MRALLLSLALTAATLVAPGGDPGGPRGESFQDGRTSGVVLRNSKIVLSGNGLGAKADGYRVQRPCWYEPGDNAGDMLRRQEDVRKYWFHTNPDGTAEDFDKFLKQYEDKVGEDGRWWTPAYNAADPNGLSCWSGLEGAVWVPAGQTPPGGITLAELYQLARAALTVPEPTINLSPDVKSYVNLPTWVWLTGVGATTRSVTAELPGVMSATVTATLSRIDIDPGTSGGRAEVKEDCGPTGRPYAKGGTWTCGVRYLRASADRPQNAYQLTVTTTWPVTGGAGFAFDPVVVDAVRQVPVGEVQTTVREGATTG